MRILADESVDFPIVERLRELGHDVLFVAEISPGIPDTHVLHMAVEEDALLLTADKDFGELVFRQRRLMKGVILIRLAGLSPQQKAEIVSQAMALYGNKMVGKFSVVGRSGVRIRHLM